MRAYFASIDHGILRTLIARRFKNPSLLALCDAVLTRVPAASGLGLPIGALTSQWFANLYLDGFDRHLLGKAPVRAMVRYMDDVVWWCGSRAEARATLDEATRWLLEHRRLTVKPGARIARSDQGLSFVGFRVFAGTLRLLLRRKRRYTAARGRWESRFARGDIDASMLQAGYASALAITHDADATGWRRAQLKRRPPVDA